jgi:hypothetical protein
MVLHHPRGIEAQAASVRASNPSGATLRPTGRAGPNLPAYSRSAATVPVGGGKGAGRARAFSRLGHAGSRGLEGDDADTDNTISYEG